MLRKLSVLFLVGVIGVSLLWAAPEKGFHLRKRSHNLPVMGGANDPQINVQTVPWRPSRHTLDEHIGITDTAGTTYYDYQHNGTCGKMIAVDDLGMVSVVWMKGLYPDPALTRLVYYNVWDPSAGNFLFGNVGIRIDPASRSGYVSQTTDANGFCYPAFHRLASNGNIHAAVAGDYAAYSDAFTSWEPDWCYSGGADMELIWPKIAMDINGVLHMVSTESPPAAGDWQRIYYSRGIPEFESGFFLDILWDEMGCGGYDLIDTVMVIAPDIACSRHTDRVAIAWCHPMDDLNNADIRNQVANDIYLSISEDGGINWGEPINVTQWTTWDSECWYNSAPNYDITCNRDTLRAYTDCSVLLDESDYVHIAFTVQPIFYYLFNDGVPDSGRYFGYWTPSLIYHWSEQTHYYSLVKNGFYSAYDPGSWQLTAQRPNLAIDPTNGYLYCSYMLYDTMTYSEGGYPMADAIVSVSTNGGTSWAVGTNVTNTTPVDIPVPTGASEHERDITVASLVRDGYLHMEYVFDKDAGGIAQGEGVATLNPVIYQRIPVNQIPTSPLVEEYPMHWDSTGYPPGEENVADISGTVGYHNSGLPIGEIAMDINPGGSTTTSVLGLYHFVDMAINTSYMVTPDGSSETSCDACIRFYDASLAAQFAIGLIELDSLQQHAADVSDNGDVTFYDASLIAQYAIGLITEWPCGYAWCFDPSSRNYNPLTGDETGEDYDGMCLGDVSGNWSGVFLAGASQRELRLQDGFTADGIFSVKNVGDQAAYAIEFDCRYDPSQLRFEGAELAGGVDDWHLYTRAEAGVIHVGAFGVTPVDVGHDIVRLQFQPIEGGHAVSGLQVDEYRVNESTIMSGSVSGMLLPIPKAYSLEQNYPNPFNPITNIRYSLPEMAGVRLTVFNMLGEQVAVLVDKIQEAGNYNVTFDGSHLSSGIYFYHLEAGDFHQIRKMILLK